MSSGCKVCYSGYWESASGMGEACRNYIRALHSAGIEMTTELMPNIKAEKKLGAGYEIARNLHGSKLDYHVKILHITPDLVTKYLTPMKYHIFHLFWETDGLPKWWVWNLNLCDEIWTGSEHNRQAFIKSGVKKPIHIFPQPIDIEVKPEPYKYITWDLNKPTKNKHEGFLFYSIFQWIERKDWRSLLTAYWKEFNEDDKVGLLLQTYKERHTHEETRQIIEEINYIKNSLKLRYYPPVYLHTEQMARSDIWRIHASGDCFVLSHRGEGWGITIPEAILCRKPVIATNLGGVHHFLGENLYYPLRPSMINVFNMDFAPWYERKQMWGQVEIDDLRKKMRAVYQKKPKEMIDNAHQYVTNNFNFGVVGAQMKKRLDEIMEKELL